MGLGELKPPVTYFGGKTAIAAQIVKLLPPHGHYVETHAGSLAVLLAKRPSAMETVNDLDQDLMTFWRVLRDRPQDLARVCALTPHSRVEASMASDPAPTWPAGLDELERARLMWVKLTQCRAGLTGQRTGWRYYQDPRGSHSSMPDYLDGYVGRIAAAAARLRGVSLEYQAASRMIELYGRHAENLLYVDPPYLQSTRQTSRGRNRGPMYASEFRTDADHAQLLEALLGCRSAVVLSGYASVLYDEVLSGWSRMELATQTGNGGDDRERVEVVWSNRPLPQGLLF
jgi:DNA adenine methylase